LLLVQGVDEMLDDGTLTAQAVENQLKLLALDDIDDDGSY
jgi:hypothetical protein